MPPLFRNLSLKRGLLLLWVAILGVAMALAALVWALSRQGADVQVRRAALQSNAACADIVQTFARAVALQGGVADERRTMDAAIDLALRDQLGVEGGLWVHGRGIVSYAFPTYDGSGIKRDVPAAERERIEAIAERALSSQAALTDTRPGLREAVVLHACPARLGGHAGWTLTRVSTVGGESLDRLVMALALLLAFVVLSGSWLGWTLTRWTGGLQQVVDGLKRAGAQPGEELKIGPTGLADLDRVGEALNGYSLRLQQAQAEASRLLGDLAQSQRLAALGRMSAGLAHEIRNPLGAVRLKAENALAARDDVALERGRSALQAVLVQTERVEALVASLLALTQPFRVERQALLINSWLNERCQLHAETAQRLQVALVFEPSPSLDDAGAVAVIDPAQVGRALDNLILNALSHTPPGGRVVASSARSETGALCIGVQDDGPGVLPEVREHLFEPFSTGRAGGTGLGLALVREIVQAHKGSVKHEAVQPHGARFTMEFPWPAC